MGSSSSRGVRSIRRLVALLIVGSVLVAVPAGAEPGIPPDITGILESDRDIDPGETRWYRVEAVDFEDESTWTFSGTGLTATVARSRSDAVRLSVTAADTAEAGPRALTVTNADGLSDTFPDAITVTGTLPPPATGDLAGQVFDDADGDGVFDAGESGLAGVSVTASDAQGADFTTATDGDGAFTLVGLATGDADVVFDTPGGYQPTTGNEVQSVTIEEATTATTQDVGYTEMPPPPSGDVFGHVFDDADGDGLLDAGESGLAGVGVSVTDAAGSSATTITDGAGDFTFDALAVGDADVTFTTPAGYALTTGNDAQTVVVVDGATTATSDVGYATIATGGVAGYVFADVNGNGVEDGADAGLAGVSVAITDAAGASSTGTTDSAGVFTFDALAVGDADVIFTTPAGHTLTTGNDVQTIEVVAEATATTEHVGYLPPETSGQPNFVVVVTDDQRWDTIGRCLPVIDGFDFDAGADACMPNLQDLLMDSGTTFLKGEVTQSLCCPSRASILTGQYTTTHGVTNNTGANLDDSSTIATWLDDVGYRNGLIGKYLNGYGFGTLENYVPPGWDHWSAFYAVGGGRGVYDDYGWIHWTAGDAEPLITQYNDADSLSGEACAPDNFYSTDFVCREAIEFLTDDTATPFFLFVNPIAPHSPTIAAARHTDAFDGIVPALYPSYDEIPSPNPPSHLQTEPLRDGHVEYITNGVEKATETVLAVDDMIGELHAQLAADGRLTNTVWVFISDNGVAIGEHRLGNKQCEYLECHRVPFVVVCPTGVCPGAAPGSVDAANYALNIDIAPTLADLAGATPTIDVDGRSLVPILEDPAAPWRTEWFLHESSPMLDGIVAVASDGHTYKYVEFINTDDIEMYDLDDDPWELANLAGNPDYASIEADLAGRLADHLSP